MKLYTFFWSRLQRGREGVGRWLACWHLLKLSWCVNGPQVSVRLALQISGIQSQWWAQLEPRPGESQACPPAEVWGKEKSVGIVVGATCGLKKDFKRFDLQIMSFCSETLHSWVRSKRPAVKTLLLFPDSVVVVCTVYFAVEGEGQEGWQSQGWGGAGGVNLKRAW